MASSQVEIVSSSPFGCVLRGHNRKERCRESNVRAVQAVFEKNFKELVRDHIQISSWVTNEQADNIGNRKEEPSAITPIRQSPVLDRWVTRQAQEVTKHVNEADPLLSHSPTNSNTNASLPTSTTNSKTKNAQLENANSVKHNIGASSLVQMWEARLNRSNSINSNQNQSQSTDPNTSTSRSCNENNASPVAVEGDSLLFDEKGTNHEDSIIDWETQSDRTAPSEPPPSSCSYSISRMSFDGGEKERVRIADIIKRLANADDDDVTHDHSQSREHKHGVLLSDQSEQRCFSQVVNSPRLRGRQAFNDLLIQMEQNKNKELDSILERQPVSKFSQRGRLQSMLRLRCLQRSLTIQDTCRPQSPGAHVNRVPLGQGSAFMHLREKFSSTGGDQHLITAQKDSAIQRCLPREVSIHLEKNSTTSKPQISEGQKVSFTEHQISTGPVNRLTVMDKNEHLHEQAKPVSDAKQKKCLESPKSSSAENEMAKNHKGFNTTNSPQGLFLNDSHEIETISSLNVYSQNEIAQEEDKHQHQQHHSLDLPKTIERTTSLNSRTKNEIEIGEEQDLCLDSQEINVDENSDQDENEELEDHYQQYSQTNYDWFSNISRPRSYWEGLRKAWYQEVINTTTKNEEIRQLVQRGRVSNFLASDFRERMDQLMISRVQIQAERVDSQEEVEDEDGMVQVMSCLHRHLHPTGGQGEEEVVYDDDDDDDEDEDEDDGDDDDDEVVVEEEEERSLISHQFHEANNYFNQSSSSLQMPSPSNLTRSWSSQDGNETGNNSDRGPSTFSPLHLHGPSSTQYYEDTRHDYSSSSISRPSLEMELIFNLRGHIEQLQQEMGELRKSILSCMDMQMKFQQYSFNREVHLVGAGAGEGRNSADRAPWKRSCCICDEMQVDSLLYRCGHMCTCLKCAQELQSSSGKCPICGAPILDVVPAK